MLRLIFKTEFNRGLAMGLVLGFTVPLIIVGILTVIFH